MRAFVAVSVAVLVAAGVAVAAVVKDDSKPEQAGPAAATRVDRFDADRAWKLVELQLAYGQRPAGSPQLRALARRLRPLLPRGRFEAVAGHPGLRNVVGVLPGRRPAIVVGAHYDSEFHPPGFVGANDSAAGTAAVIELARDLAAQPRPPNAREVRFVLFDGEEEPPGSTDFLADALLGAEGAGFLISQQRLYPGRIHHCMRWLGVSRRAFDMLCERATYRYARAARFYDGPDEVHRESVARQILRGYQAPPDGVPTEHIPTRREEARRRFADILEAVTAND